MGAMRLRSTFFAAFVTLLSAATVTGCSSTEQEEDADADQGELVGASRARPKERLLGRGDPNRRVLVVVSASTTINLLADDRNPARKYVTGVFARELSEPLKVLAQEGYSFDFVTPGGVAPTWDINGLELPWFFWGDSEHFIGDQMIKDAVVSGRSRDEAVSLLMEAFGSLKLSDKKTLSHLELPLSMRRWKQWEADENMRPIPPKSLAEAARAIAAAAESGAPNPYVGIVVPGGHAPMGDLAYDQDMATILRHAHQQKLPTALVCHGPVALLSTTGKKSPEEWRAMTDEERRAWPYYGYTLTVESTREEKIMEKAFAGGQKVEYYVDGELERAGAKLAPAQIAGRESPLPGLAKVSADREVVTGQSPASANCMGRVLHESIQLAAKNPGQDWWRERRDPSCDGQR